MADDQVVRSVGDLVVAGAYLDELPGVPGGVHPNGGVFRDGRRIYARGSDEYAEASAAGLVDRLPALTVASEEAVEEVEGMLGCRLPEPLRRLYLEVGNGGFGPGYGILGVRGGHEDFDQRTASDLYRDARSGSLEGWESLPVGLLPVCYWGCSTYSFVDCSDSPGSMWAWDPNLVWDTDPSQALFRQSITFTEWLARWVDRRLYQPFLGQDPETGEWREATDEEYEQMMGGASN